MKYEPEKRAGLFENPWVDSLILPIVLYAMAAVLAVGLVATLQQWGWM